MENDDDALIELDLKLTESPPSWVREVQAKLDAVGADYPHQNPTRALALFREALALAPPAPSLRARTLYGPGGLVDFAAWAGWVCLDMLDYERQGLAEYLLVVAEKAPDTHQRILERIEATRSERALQDRLDADSAALEQELEASGITGPTLDRWLATAEEAGAWWALRDGGVRLSRRGHGDAAWRTFNLALRVIARVGKGNLGSVYEGMGDLCKREARYASAAEMYLLACLYGGPPMPQRPADQLRVSLKKAGLSDEATEIRDGLVAGVGLRPRHVLLGELRAHLERAR
jgi:hypothetical protein